VTTKRIILAWIAVVAAMVCEIVAQVPNAKITDFTAPNTDSAGRKSVIKGDAEPAGQGIFRIRKLHIDNYRVDGPLDSTIDSSECLFDRNTHDVWSDKDLALKTMDGRLTLKGFGFRFANSRLTISNKVDALIRRQTLVSVTAGATNISTAGTNDYLRMTADRLEYLVDALTFGGHVRVVDPQGEVRCETLKVKLADKNALQEVEALDDVVIVEKGTGTEKGTEASGKRAIYSPSSGLLRLSENTHWRMGDREGESELLILDRTNKTLRAETKVRMSIPSSLLATNAAGEKSARSSTNKLTISADTFDFAQTNAVTDGPIAIFNGDVHAVDPQATLDCQLLTIFFNHTNRLTRAVAERDVQITRTDGSIQGLRAVFENDEITVPANPKWRLRDNAGTAETLAFNPRTREVRALNKVRMEIPVAGTTNLFSGGSSSTNRAKPTGTNILVVTADYFTNKESVATFSGNVRASEPRGQIDANRVELHLNSTNRVQRVIAEGDVIITEQRIQAIGQKADYDVTTGVIRLTGAPRVMSEESETIAREFVVDLVKHTREPLPPFQIKIRNLNKTKGATVLGDIHPLGGRK
jgi:lipopolysaccharide transport protein LptA